MQAVLHFQAACAFCPAERRVSWTARPASPKDWRSLCRNRCFPPAKTAVPMLEDGSPVPGRPYPVLRFSHDPGRKTCFPPRKRTAWRARYSPGPAGHPPRKRTDPKILGGEVRHQDVQFFTYLRVAELICLLSVAPQIRCFVLPWEHVAVAGNRGKLYGSWPPDFHNPGGLASCQKPSSTCTPVPQA